MSDVSESAHVNLIVADYGAIDRGKINILGAGIDILGYNPQTNASSPFTVIASVSFGPQFAGESPAIEVQLEYLNGEIVALPGAVGGVDQPQYVRLGASDPLELPAAPGLSLPPGVMRPHAHLVLNFGTGLPLATGDVYRWRVKIDQQTRDQWTTLMFMPAPPRGGVIG